MGNRRNVEVHLEARANYRPDEMMGPTITTGLVLDVSDPGLFLSGKIDRIDVDPFSARGIVADYKSGKSVHSAAQIESEQRLQALTQVLEEKLVKRKVSLKCLDYGKVEEATKGTVRQVATLKAGIGADKAREINKFLKDKGPKGIQSSTQGDEVRVTGKKRDDLQEAIALLASREDAKILAGGHSLLPAMKLRLSAPALLVDLSRVAGLNYIKEAGDVIRIGATTTRARALSTAQCLVKAPARRTHRHVVHSPLPARRQRQIVHPDRRRSGRQRDGMLTLRVSPGVAAYAFTFG